MCVSPCRLALDLSSNRLFAPAGTLNGVRLTDVETQAGRRARSDISFPVFTSLSQLQILTTISLPLTDLSLPPPPQVGDMMLSLTNPFSSAASATAASIIPGLAGAGPGQAGQGQGQGWNPFQQNQQQQQDGGGGGAARRPPLDRWTLFRINLWELRAQSWERISWKNDQTTPSADFFVDEIRLVRFNENPANPNAPPAAASGGFGGGFGGGAGGSGGVAGPGRQTGGLGAGGAGAGGAGGVVTASQGQPGQTSGVIVNPAGGSVVTNGGSPGSGVSVVNIPNVAGGAVRPEGAITGVQPDPWTYSADTGPGVRLLDTKTTVRVYLNSLCLAPNLAAWWVGCWCAVCYVDVDPTKLGPLQNTILGRYVVMQDFVSSTYLVRPDCVVVVSMLRSTVSHQLVSLQPTQFQSNCGFFDTLGVACVVILWERAFF